MATASPTAGDKTPPPLYKRLATVDEIQSSPTHTMDLEKKRVGSGSSDSTLFDTIRTLKHTASDSFVEGAKVFEPPNRKWKDVINDQWLWELGALLLSITSLITLIAILRKYEGKPTPQWPLHITINALISVCSMIFKGAMIVPVEECISQLKWIWFWNKKPLKGMEIFDRASRGPEGSVHLLFSRQGLSLGSIGALITILAVASDPFFQQVVNYPTQSVPIEKSDLQQAKLFRAVSYEEIGPFGSQQQLAPAIPMQKAIYGSLFDGPTTMTATCPSGNCTWDIFTTLGVCSKCQDVSSTIMQSTVISPSRLPDFDEATAMNITNYRIPSGLHVTLPDYVDSGAEALFPVIIASNSSAPLATDASIPWTITNISIMSHRTAFECSLFWCLKSYNSSMTRGLLTEIAISTAESITTFDQYNGTQKADLCATEPQRISNEPPAAPKPGQLIYVSATNSDSITDSCITHLYSNNTAFSFSSSANAALQNFLTPLLTGNITWQGLDSFAASSAVLQSLTTYGKTNMSIFSSDSTIVQKASRAIAGEIDLTNVPTLLEKLTESMTVRMRMAALMDENSTTLGTVFETQAVVQIDWPWLALPLLLLVGTTVFLTVVIWVSRRTQVQAWKSSSTAMLFHGLDEKHSQRLGSSAKRSEMDDLAKEIEVQLGHTDKGWRLT